MTIRPLELKTALILGTLLISSSLMAQGEKITFSTMGGSAKKVLADLSAKTGLHLETNPQTEADFLLVNVKDVPTTKLLQDIAWSVWGSWKKEGDTYILVRTDSDRVAADRAAREHEAEAFRIGLEARKKKQAEQGAFTEAKANDIATKMAAMAKTYKSDKVDRNFYPSLNRLSRGAPIYRAMNRLASLLTPKELAELPSDIPVVYTNRPTAMQRAIGPAGNAILNSYLREETMWLEAARRANLQAPADGDTVLTIPGIPSVDNPTLPDRLVLVVSKMSVVRGAVMLQLYATNAKGESLGRADDVLAAEDLESMMIGGDQPNGVEVKLPDSYNEASKAITGSEQISQALLSKILDPEQVDPLSIFVSPVIHAYAEAAKTNIVASLPDLELTLGGGMGSGKLTTAMLEKMQRLLMVTKVEDGVTCWRPTDYKVHVEKRANRKYLAEYLRRQTLPSGLNLEEKAYWSYRLPLDEISGQFTSTLSRIVRRAAMGIAEDSYSNARVLKLYGSLTTDQRKLLRQGGLPVSALSRDQAQELFELTYGMYPQLQIQSGNPGNEPYSYSEVNRMPTEALPTGISPQALITLEDSSEDVVFANFTYGEGQGSSNTPMNAQTAAWNRFSATRPDLYPWVQNQKYDFEKVLLGKVMRYTITIAYNDKVSQAFQLEDRQYSSMRPIRFDQITGEYLKAYQEAYKSYEESAKHEQGVRAPANNNPPPPLW